MIAQSTLSLIIGFEGKRNRAYKDSRGLPTIGVGHLILPSESYLLTATLTDEQVEDLLRKDLEWCETAINGCIQTPINQNEFDALCSLCFNIGAANFKNSLVVKKLNANDYQGAADAFLNWDKPPELLGRRQKERELFIGA